MKKRKTNRDDNDKKEEVISELEQCREDERDSQNQVIQVIVTAGTILALIFGISRLGEKEYISVLFHLSNLVLCTTVCYITSLGISAVLRYHYMRNLEDQLANNGNQNKMVHWNSFISPITTKNPLHMYNVIFAIHFLLFVQFYFVL